MRDDRDTLEYGLAGLWSQLRYAARDNLRTLASIGFMLLAVGAIQFQENMSPTLGRITGFAVAGASKTFRVANQAVMSAALPFFLRG
jgi:hypothetical protein